MTFHNPTLLLLILLVPVYLFFYWRQQKGVAVRFSSTKILKGIGPSPSLVFRHIVAVLRSGAILLLVVALARPQKGIEESKVTTEGIDIILSLDVSGSMDAYDMTLAGKHTSRLEVVKKVAKDFIAGRPHDRIGLVVYALWAYTQCPLTLDHSLLLDLLEKVRIGMINPDRTAIGLAITTSLNRLRATEAKSKVIILLTDGSNNVPRIDPITAASAARALDVKIYTIGAGTVGIVPVPVKNREGKIVGWGKQRFNLDEKALKKIADITQGEYFPARDTGSLEKIFEIIDQMEKTTAEVTIYTDYNELFPYFAFAALFSVLIGVILEKTRFRKLP